VRIRKRLQLPAQLPRAAELPPVREQGCERHGLINNCALLCSLPIFSAATPLRLAILVILPALAFLVACHGSQLYSVAALVGLQLHAGDAPQVAWPIGLHGRVHKAGPIDLARFHPRLVSACHAERLAWTAAAAGRSNLTQAELPSLHRGPCVHCQVFVNHLFKILYLRQPKAASSTLLGYFGQCISGGSARNRWVN
jgi:hypothetical protein